MGDSPWASSCDLEMTVQGAATSQAIILKPFVQFGQSEYFECLMLVNYFKGDLPFVSFHIISPHVKCFEIRRAQGLRQKGMMKGLQVTEICNKILASKKVRRH